MTRITLTQLLLGASLCFASASIAYDRHVVGAALMVGPAHARIQGEWNVPAGAIRNRSSSRPGLDLGVRIAWRTNAQAVPAANVAASLSIQVERSQWI